VSVRTSRAVLGLLGIGALARGGWLLLTDVPPRSWPYVLLWLALGVVVHDGLVAPASAALGAGALPRLPAGWRLAVRGAWIAAGSMVLIGLPLLIGARHRANPSVIPQDPAVSLGAAVLLVVAGAAITGVALVVRAHVHSGRSSGSGTLRTAGPDGAGPGTPGPPSATPH
jgi:hypothetical protein